MAQQEPQNFSNHTRTIPLYHYVAMPLLALNLLWTGYQLFNRLLEESGRRNAAAQFVVAGVLLILVFYARIMALTVQDRVIRLEETLRMQRLLPENLRSRIGEFSVAQMVALRFASDAELPELAAKVLSDKIAERKAIKLMIKNWRADYQRA